MGTAVRPALPNLLVFAVFAIVKAQSAQAQISRYDELANLPFFWADKIQANRKRDERVHRALRRRGWTVLTVWGCRASSVADLNRAVNPRFATHSVRVVQLSFSSSSVSTQVLSGLYRVIAEAIFVVSGPRSF